MNNQNNFMIVQGENLDENQLLGKFVYYSLADVLVDKDDFTRICLSMNFPYAARRISVVDAFRNATGRVTRSITQNSHGSQEIFRIYCRDNMRDGQIYSRELVRETVGLSTNQYEKLANVCYDRDRDSAILNRTIRPLMSHSFATRWSSGLRFTATALAAVRSTRS